MELNGHITYFLKTPLSKKKLYQGINLLRIKAPAFINVSKILLLGSGPIIVSRIGSCIMIRSGDLFNASCKACSKWVISFSSFLISFL
jgi:hypothetical protein